MADEIGVAYLSVKPKVDDGFGASLSASGNSGGKMFGGAFGVAAGNLMSSAVEKFGAAVGDVFRNAFDNYANYEQLVGGVDTLFKEASDTVQKNAAAAYRTAGLSANEYMETVTSFSASMISSLGGDTAKAADYADMAMRDMSDNANKMGTSMDELQRAYMSMARGNYGMLDSLKIGYGGTKEEMQRMLADAEKISGVKYDISNFSDVTEAIHVMQTEMGITGTTAKEAQETISGSISMLSASWQNFLTGLADEKADLGALGEQLFDSLGAVLKNVVPRIGVLAQNLLLGIPDAIRQTLFMFPTILAPALMEVFGQKTGILITDALFSASDQIVGVFDQFAASLTTVFESIGGFILGNVVPLVMQVVGIVMPAVETISGSIAEHMPSIQNLIQTAMDTIGNIVITVWPYIASVITNAVAGISQVIQVAWPIISAVIATAMDAISALIRVAWPAIQAVIRTVMGAISGTINTVWNAIVGFITGACGNITSTIEGIRNLIGIVQGIFDAVRQAIEDPIGTAQRFIEDFANTIEGIIGGMDLSLPDIALPHFWVNGGEFPYGVGGMGYPPDFGVDWYGQGGFANQPTLTGYGERGLEMYWPSYSPYFDKYAKGIAEHMPARGGVDIHDCTFNVRKEGDIRAVANELNTLINRQTNGGLA